MAQYSLANQAGALFRAALNAVLGKLQRNYYGTVDPSSVSESTPGMWWIDTNPAQPIGKIRNASDTSWLSGYRVDASAVTWVGQVETAAATLTGGSINGMVIGGATPAAATFTTLGATGDLTVANASPIIRLTETDGTSTHSQTGIAHGSNAFVLDTRNSAGVFVAQDYVMTKGATGATQHSWRVLGEERVRIGSAAGFNSGSFVAFNVSGGNINFGVDAITGITTTRTIRPDGSGTRDNGEAGRRWANIYLANSPNVSSDARLKSAIADLTDAERRAAGKIKARTFTMLDTGQRKVGYIAQEVIEAMRSEELDAFAYGLVTDGEFYGVDMDAINAFRLG